MTEHGKAPRKPSGAVAHGLSLFATDKRARVASRRSRLAAWLAALAFAVSCAALLVAAGVLPPSWRAQAPGAVSAPAPETVE